MKKTKTAGDVFIETFNHSISDKFEHTEYKADTYYALLIQFGVPLEFNNEGLLSASKIQKWAESNTSFKKFLINSWGKNAKEGFSNFKNQVCAPYVEDKKKKEVWLSSYMAWSYAQYASAKLSVEYSCYIWQMFEEMADPEIHLDRELKQLKNKGHDMGNVISITGKTYTD